MSLWSMSSCEWTHADPLAHPAWLAAHQASFDMSVLRHSLTAAGLEIPASTYFCTVQLARKHWQKLKLSSHTLDFLAATFDIELDHHDGLSDANACAQLLVKALAERGTKNAADLLQGLNLSPQILGASSRRARSGVGTTARHASIEDFDAGSLTSLQGKAVSLTGKLGPFTRKQGEQLVKTAGGEFHKKPKRGTDIVVVGPYDIRSLAKGETKTVRLNRALKLQEDGHDLVSTTSDEFLKMILVADDD